ncbi:MAG TPA: hypothetical protein VLV78_20575 [Thermoanaerobaculia bacterium]|nr:hypothetical protein [Thermoanaerobaculia bacterium]
MKTSSIAYMAVTAGFLSALLLAFSNLHRAAGAVLVTVGVASIFLARLLAEAQNEINRFTDRFLPNPWGRTRPQLFIIWGIGVGLLGLMLLLRLL